MEERGGSQGGRRHEVKRGDPSTRTAEGEKRRGAPRERHRGWKGAEEDARASGVSLSGRSEPSIHAPPLRVPAQATRDCGAFFLCAHERRPAGAKLLGLPYVRKHRVRPTDRHVPFAPHGSIHAGCVPHSFIRPTRSYRTRAAHEALGTWLSVSTHDLARASNGYVCASWGRMGTLRRRKRKSSRERESPAARVARGSRRLAHVRERWRRSELVRAVGERYSVRRARVRARRRREPRSRESSPASASGIEHSQDPFPRDRVSPRPLRSPAS